MTTPPAHPASWALAALLMAAALPASAADVLTRNDTLVLTDPGTATLTHSITQWVDLSSQPFTAGDTFHDRYTFDVTGGLFSAAAGTFELTIGTTAVFQLQDLQLRLFQLDNPALPVGDVSAGTPANTTLLYASAETTGQDTIPTMSLSAGRYLLEVNGLVTGTAGGSYAGVINLASVAAVPEAPGLLMATVGGVALMLRRRGRPGQAA